MGNIKVTSMTVEEIQAATAALKDLRQKMTFVLPLSPAERLASSKIGKKTVQTTQMRLAAVREHRDALPASFDLRKFERETGLLTALDDCLTAAKEIQMGVRDTLQAVGTGALQSAKVAFGHIQVAANANDGLKHAVHHLKLRARKPKPALEPGPSPTPQAPAVPPAPETPAEKPNNKAA